MKTNIINPVEVEIAEKLIDGILDAGHLIAVWDGEDLAIKRTCDRVAIAAALASTRMDWLNVYDSNGGLRGAFLLVYGNGEDLISDHTDNEYCHDLLIRLALAEADLEDLPPALPVRMDLYHRVRQAIGDGGPQLESRAYEDRIDQIIKDAEPNDLLAWISDAVETMMEEAYNGK